MQSTNNHQNIDYSHYVARLPNQTLASFLKAIHDDDSLAAKVKSIKFTFPADDIATNGLIDLMNPILPAYAFTDRPDEGIYPAITTAALRLKYLQRKHCNDSSIELKLNSLELVPAEALLHVYYFLFMSVCKGVEAIEVPTVWNKPAVQQGFSRDWKMVGGEEGGWVRYEKLEPAA